MAAKIKLTLGANKVRAEEVYALLDQTYPDAECSLTHADPLQLLVATILSAQCTDARVNIVTKDLFKEFTCARDYVEKPLAKLEKLINSCGFYRNKAKNIVAASKSIVEKHGGEVPDTLDELVQLAGVGRKTANVVLGAWFKVPGIAVDTHCGRISKRLGFTKNTDPVKVEHDLMKVWEREHWTLFSHFMVFHGRAVCQSRTPKCSECRLRELCPFPETREGRKIAK